MKQYPREPVVEADGVATMQGKQQIVAHVPGIPRCWRP